MKALKIFFISFLTVFSFYLFNSSSCNPKDPDNKDCVYKETSDTYSALTGANFESVYLDSGYRQLKLVVPNQNFVFCVCSNLDMSHNFSVKFYQEPQNFLVHSEIKASDYSYTDKVLMQQNPDDTTYYELTSASSAITAVWSIPDEASFNWTIYFTFPQQGSLSADVNFLLSKLASIHVKITYYNLVS